MNRTFIDCDVNNFCRWSRHTLLDHDVQKVQGREAAVTWRAKRRCRHKST